MTDPYIIQLLKRFFQGSLSIEEKETLAEWVERQDEDELSQIVEQSWMEFETGESLPAGKANDLLLSILEGAKSQEKHKVIPLRPRRTWKYIAAAASIVVILGIISYFVINNRTRTLPPVAVAKISNDIKAPGATKAIITLANGKQIVLDSAGNGTLAMQGNVRVIKKEDGQIEYTSAAGSPGGLEDSYNTLTNPRGSKVFSLVLSDGSKVWLNAESSLRYPVGFSNKERAVSITGEAYFEVSHDAARPFIVSKGAMQVKVLGTHFNVNTYDDEAEMKITLLEGSVKVSQGAAGKVIKPGEQAQIENHGNSSTPKIMVQAADLDAVMAWKNGLFSFNKVDLQTVLRQLTKWYDVDVEYQGNIPTQTFGGDIERTLSLSQVLKVLEKSEVHFKIEGKKILVMP